MYPTLFTIGNFNIPTYTVLLDLGLILGLLLTYYEGKRRLGSGTLALDLGLWVVIGGIVGGRVGYVLANWRTFSEDWPSVIRIWQGGLSFHGAVLGGLLVMVLFAYLHQRDEQPVSLGQLADVLTPGLALSIAFGWAACLMGGCAYGNLGEGFGYAILPDLYGVEASRFATQAVGLGISLLLLLGVWLARRRLPFTGALFLLYWFLYCSAQFFLEFTRGDEAIYVGPWRLAQVLNLALALASGLGLLVLWWQWRKLDEEEDITTEEEGSTSLPNAPDALGSDAEDETVVEEPAVPDPQSDPVETDGAEAGETADVE
jgi:phosphatidylglycerol:prolipoprotein diacylglycerol transferase